MLFIFCIARMHVIFVTHLWGLSRLGHAVCKFLGGGRKLLSTWLYKCSLKATFDSHYFIALGDRKNKYIDDKSDLVETFYRI